MNGATMLVRDVMSKDLHTVDMNAQLSTAEEVMDLGKVRHMPVLDDEGDLVGIVSQRDLFHNALLRALGYGSHAAEKVMQQLLVKEAMTTHVITTTPDATVGEAARLMRDRKVGSLVVVDGTRPVGIVTESDLLAILAGQAPR
jgi:acetoin utilization protein AcuB